MAGSLSESEAADAAAVQLQQFKLEERRRDKTMMASKDRQDAAFKNKLAERQKRRQEQQMFEQDEEHKKELTAKGVLKVRPPNCTDEVTFVSVKVKDLTALWESLEAKTVNSSLQLYVDSAERVSIEYEGYAVSSSAESGPALMAFQTAVSAVHWCLALQGELLKMSWPVELLQHTSCKELVLDSDHDVILFRGLRIQMGIDRGKVQMTSQDKHSVTYSGLAVHRSNALSNAAQGGQILISTEAWNAVTVDTVTVKHQANNLGSMKLAGATKPIEVFEIYPQDISARSKIFGSTCAGCFQPIRPGQEFLKAMGYKWHVDHFCCAQCGKGLQGSFISQDGKPYCEEDFYEMTATKCKGCGKTIKAGFIEALGGLWHPHCFVCQKCRRMPSENDNIYELNSMPYCESCFMAQGQ